MQAGGNAGTVCLRIDHIQNVNDPLTAYEALGSAPWIGHNRLVEQFPSCTRYTTNCDCPKDLAVEAIQHAERRLAEPHRLFEHRVKNGREVAGSRIDDLQDLGGRGLLFDGIKKFSSPIL